MFILAIDIIDGCVDIIHWFLLAVQHKIVAMDLRS
jgi:hypothetical protein